MDRILHCFSVGDQLEHTYEVALPGKIFKKLKIYFVDQATDKQFIKNLVAFQLEDGAIFIYSTTRNKKAYQFPNLFQEQKSQLNYCSQQVSIFYCPPQYFFVVSNNQAAIWTIENVFERIVSLDHVQSLFQLDKHLDQHFNPIVSYNDYSTFSKLGSTDHFSLLEFSQRSFNYQINYRKELSEKHQTKQLYYESLSLLLRLKSQSLEFFEILSIMKYYPQSMVYRNSHIGMVIFE